MADKLTLASLSNLMSITSASAAVNSNNAAIVNAVDNTLSRDGTQPNSMGANLDMNSNRILNLPAPINVLEPARLTDLNTLNGGGTITVQPIPPGGTTGQVLEKNSNTNYDAGWYTLPVIPVSVSSLNTQTGALTTNTTLTNSGTVFSVANGALVQSTSAVSNGLQANTTVFTFGDTIPTNTNGSEILTVTITPKFSTSTLRISYGTVATNSSAGSSLGLGLFQDAITNALSGVVAAIPGASYMVPLASFHTMTAGTTSAITFRMRLGTTTGTWSCNGTSGSRIWGGIMRTYINVDEIKG